MDGLRFWLGILTIGFGTGALFYWISIHPRISFWRRLGSRTTIAIHLVGILGVAAVAIYFREEIMLGDLGGNGWTVAFGMMLLIGNGVMRYFQSRQLDNSTLLGVPELSGTPGDSRLITEGIYARLRHPRYVQLLLAFGAYTLPVNYIVTYLYFGVTLLAVYLVVVLEERELRERFGDEYRRYAAKVPRFIPGSPW